MFGHGSKDGITFFYILAWRSQFRLPRRLRQVQFIASFRLRFSLQPVNEQDAVQMIRLPLRRKQVLRCPEILRQPDQLLVIRERIFGRHGGNSRHEQQADKEINPAEDKMGTKNKSELHQIHHA